MIVASPSKRSFAAVALVVLATVAAAAAGALASGSAPDFYAALAKPMWAPPAAAFGPVWSILYVLMAVAAWLVIRAVGWAEARPAIALYGAQLVCNGLWTWLFFRWRQGGAALADILLLIALLLLTVRSFWRRRPLAAALLLPYLAWVSFAAALTYAVWRRNPGLL